MVHLFLRKKDGAFAVRQDIRLKWPGPGHSGPFGGFGRAVTNPHLLDWNRDGHTDLVVGHVGHWTLHVGAGPLAGKTEVAVKPFALPALPDARPLDFGFADWDGDARFDLLVALEYQKGSDDARQHQKGTNEPVSHSIYWFRNTAAKGEPKFAAGSQLLSIPAPWQLDAFSVVGQDLVVSVSKNVHMNWLDGSFQVESQLWRYRRQN
jgi:hypothetical protein